MNRPRKQTYTMDMYLSKIKDRDIRNDSDTQRQFVWSNEQINELIATVLTEDYIPPIILADEPTGNLDSHSGIEVMKILHELHEEGRTIILITHDNEIANEAQRVIRIQDGQIVSDIINK